MTACYPALLLTITHICLTGLKPLLGHIQVKVIVDPPYCWEGDPQLQVPGNAAPQHGIYSTLMSGVHLFLHFSNT